MKLVSSLMMFFLSAISFANESSEPLDASRSFLCKTSASQYILSAPEKDGSRELKNPKNQTISLAVCTDSTKNNNDFGVPGGELVCFDQMSLSKWRFTLILADGMEGKKGQFRIHSTETGSLHDQGTCVYKQSR